MPAAEPTTGARHKGHDANSDASVFFSMFEKQQSHVHTWVPLKNIPERGYLGPIIDDELQWAGSKLIFQSILAMSWDIYKGPLEK